MTDVGQRLFGMKCGTPFPLAAISCHMSPITVKHAQLGAPALFAALAGQKKKRLSTWISSTVKKSMSFDVRRSATLSEIIDINSFCLWDSVVQKPREKVFHVNCGDL